MNRRAFLVSLPFLPAAAKAVLNFAPATVAPHVTEYPTGFGYIPYNANAWSIQEALADCDKVIDSTKPLDLDEIFRLMYELKRSREKYPAALFYLDTEGTPRCL